MKTFSSLERSESLCKERLVKQIYINSFFFMYIWIMFLLSGFGIGCAVVMPLIMLHQCNHCDYSCCCSNLAQSRDCFPGQLLQGPTRLTRLSP